MLNTFQILYKHLANDTMIRLNSLYPNDFLEDTLRRRIGFVPLKIERYLTGEHYVFRGSIIMFHFVDELLHVYMDKYTSVHFLVTKSEDTIVLSAYHLTFHKSKDVQLLIKNLKNSFQEFTLGTCLIDHCYSIQIRIHTLQKSGDPVITLPYYIDSNIIEAVV